MIKHMGLYVTFCDDCDENEGGYYCQIYADEYMENDLDNFCVHPGGFKTFQDVINLAKAHVKANFPYYAGQLHDHRAIIYPKEMFYETDEVHNYQEWNIVCYASCLKLETVTSAELLGRFIQGTFDPDIHNAVFIK